MGSFDVVYFNCPHCNNLMSEQSKSGPCKLKNIDLVTDNSTAGEAVLGLYRCNECQNYLEIIKENIPSYKVIKYNE